MKTYSGELKDGMPFKDKNGDIDVFSSTYHHTAVIEIYHDNEWQLYKPQAKKVWGIPEIGELFYIILQDAHGEFYVHKCEKTDECLGEKPVYLDKHTAEHHAKALNYINEFRALSDVPVDGVRMYFITSTGEIDWQIDRKYLRDVIAGVVVYEGRQHELEQWRERACIAHKIVTWGFHGIVNAVL
jgi:hypothetical protein